ncbi:MAG: archaea-specific SMC-related protein [Halobacteriota archaeon]
MNSTQTTERSRVTVENLGGIDSTTVELDDGVNVLAGRNATNRTSLLRAIMAALGSDDVSLKADAESGRVALEADGQTYTRELERTNGSVVYSGEPYLEDSTVADLFAFLLEVNESRQAVSRGEDLRDLIMRPVDVDEIHDEIDANRSERRRIDEEIDRLESLQAELPSLESRRTSLEEELHAVEAELTEKRTAVANTDAAAAKEDKAELDTKLAEFQSLQSSIENTRFQLETETESVETLQAELESLRSELEALPESPDLDVDAIDAELDRLRDKQSSNDASTSQLQSIIQFNQEMLDGADTDIVSALREDTDDSPADKLLEDESSVVCWTCGSYVETAQIESTIDSMRSLRQEKLSERNRIKAEISELQSKKREANRHRERRSEIERRIERTERELHNRKERRESLTEERNTLKERLEELESEIERLEAQTQSETLEQHKEINRLELRRDRLESDIADVESRIDDTEAELDRLESLRSDRERVTERLSELRTRIERLEAESIEAFNEHMDAVLDVLEYENLERIWIERVERTVREGRKKVERSVFDLHIVRKTGDGTAYEDTIDHLSESEREVTGLVFALAGYLVHEVHKTVPFMLLDSLEAIDSDRIAALVEYFSEYADTVVVALLPEDAAALDSDYNRIREI